MLFNQDQFTEKIWQAVLHEINLGWTVASHPFRFVNLGTFGELGPEVRTVILREFEKVLDFYVFTDFRSDKVRELRSNPSATLHFYHPEKRVQIRVKAKAEIHHQDLVSDAFWDRVKGDSRLAYNSVLAPGTEIPTPQDGFDWTEEIDDRFFTVLRFIPFSFEVLQLNGLKHMKILFSKKGGEWIGQWLVP